VKLHKLKVEMLKELEHELTEREGEIERERERDKALKG
jgi:hypothetical protein